MNISVYAIPGINFQIDTAVIDRAVCTAFDIPVEALRKRTRRRKIVEARHTAMYFYMKNTDHTTPQIGWMLGRYDHSTVIYACKSVRNLLDTDREYQEKYKQVKNKLLCPLPTS